ncbi:MAG: hypothetical protein EB154_06165 [Nitrosopumilaceae archaeon]|nr:hypothetical protein [Nitrosopumilaceae archaeon]NDB89327.1 hypothetical protein [Nitrososphaerota archaeon]NDF35431.1 hypothetical protein [Nitrosopumilaceae archaeon]NDF47760.1 hypothetical protein [Nitrosopumilaceae archaeon]
MFFLVLLTGGLSVSYLIIDKQSDMIKAQQVIADSEIKKIQEKFTISVSTDAANKNRLAVYVKNQGSNTLQIDNIWIVNQTSASKPATKIDTNYTESVLAPGYGTEILKNYPLYMNSGDYVIKVISSIGTIRATDLSVGGTGPLKAKMMIDPPDVRIGENATVWLFVTNTGTTKLLNVTASPVLVSPSSTVLLSSPPVQSMSGLSPAESKIISWKYTLMGTIGTNVTFSGNATGIDEATNTLVKTNTVKQTIYLRDNNGLGTILTQTLLSKPEIFMILPSPFGDSGQKGLWGVNVVNPTSQPIYVSKVVINAVTPRAQSNDKIFDTSNCAPVTVAPTPNSWSCPAGNQLMWKNTITPQMIPAKSVFPFLTQVTSGSLAGAQDDLETVLIQTNVFTTLGQFGKAGYGSSMRNTGSSMPNVFLAKTTGSSNPTDIITNMTNIKPGSYKTFNATIADFDTGTTNVISSGSRLIINIPKGWSDVTILSYDGFSAPTYQSFTDTSSQIVGILNTDVTGAAGTAKTIQFRAKAPPIFDTQMYVMYILADGDVNNQFPIGPLAEVLLQVTP